MLRNKQLLTLLVPLYLLAAVLFTLILVAPPVSAAPGYSDCLSKLSKVDDVSKLKQKAINPSVDKRLKVVDELRKKSNTLAEDQKSVIQSGLNADETFLKDLKSSSSGITDVKKLQTNYCDGVYKTQMYEYRSRQVSYIKFVNDNLKRDQGMQRLLDHPFNVNIQSKLKDDVDQRLNTAREITAANVAAEQAAAKLILDAKINGTTNNLTKPNFGGRDVFAEYHTAQKNYTESLAIRVAAKQFSPDRDLTLVSVELKDNEGKVVTKKFRNATKAVVKVKVGDDKGDTTINLTRPDHRKSFRVVK